MKDNVLWPHLDNVCSLCQHLQLTPIPVTVTVRGRCLIESQVAEVVYYLYALYSVSSIHHLASFLVCTAR